jgi:acyl carrier protein
MMSARALAEAELRVSIGQPLANMEIYVLDEHLELVAPGVVGELYIGGVGVGAGYWQREDLSQEKFIANDLSGSGILYRTGDLGYWRASGELEFIGRRDDQVQLRGFRVELGEIEAVLAKQPGIKAGAVVLREDYLCAYVVLEKAETLDTEALKQNLQRQLPAYMVPVAYYELQALPLTPMGKVDKKALPEFKRKAKQKVKLKANTDSEKKLVQIWEEVLGIDGIGIQDNFFDLGGHSLLATQLLVRINQAFAVTLSLRNIFEYASIQQLADLIKHSTQVQVSEQNQTLDLNLDAMALINELTDEQAQALLDKINLASMAPQSKLV